VPKKRHRTDLIVDDEHDISIQINLLGTIELIKLHYVKKEPLCVSHKYLCKTVKDKLVTIDDKYRTIRPEQLIFFYLSDKNTIRLCDVAEVEGEYNFYAGVK
jgi:hypothetical protein